MRMTGDGLRRNPDGPVPPARRWRREVEGWVPTRIDPDIAPSLHDREDLQPARRVVALARGIVTPSMEGADQSVVGDPALAQVGAPVGAGTLDRVHEACAVPRDGDAAPELLGRHDLAATKLPGSTCDIPGL